MNGIEESRQRCQLLVFLWAVLLYDVVAIVVSPWTAVLANVGGPIQVGLVMGWAALARTSSAARFAAGMATIALWIVVLAIIRAAGIDRARAAVELHRAAIELTSLTMTVFAIGGAAQMVGLRLQLRERRLSLRESTSVGGAKGDLCERAASSPRRLQFSLRDVFAATTAAALLLGLSGIPTQSGRFPQHWEFALYGAYHGLVTAAACWTALGEGKLGHRLAAVTIVIVGLCMLCMWAQVFIPWKHDIEALFVLFGLMIAMPLHVLAVSLLLLLLRGAGYRLVREPSTPMSVAPD